LYLWKNTTISILIIPGANVKKKPPRGPAARDVCTPEIYIVTACEHTFDNITKEDFQSLKRFNKVTHQEEIHGTEDY
jgi:hypothetical protein